MVAFKSLHKLVKTTSWFVLETVVKIVLASCSPAYISVCDSAMVGFKKEIESIAKFNANKSDVKKF